MEKADRIQCAKKSSCWNVTFEQRSGWSEGVGHAVQLKEVLQADRTVG